MAISNRGERFKSDRDDVLRPDTISQESPRELVGAPLEGRVGQRLVIEDQRDVVRRLPTCRSKKPISVPRKRLLPVRRLL